MFENIQRSKKPKEALDLAKEETNIIADLGVCNCGRYPNPIRWPGLGRAGELWFRNRLLWLRTIPLGEKVSFITTHAEAPIYFSTGIKCSADLLGIWRNGSNETKLGVAELKAGGEGDNVIYAIIEGVRNIKLHHSNQGFERLHKGWSMAMKRFPKYYKNAWGGKNPFSKKPAKAQLIILGDINWIKAQSEWKECSNELISHIKRILHFDVSIYSLCEKAKASSNPYMLLPLKKWNCS